MVVSALLGLHLVVMLFTPNKGSYVGRLLSPWMSPYTRLFEIDAQWNFFAPDPGPPPVYLEWELLGEGGEVLESESLPPKEDPYFLRERFNRRLAFARFSLNAVDRWESIVLPRLCKKSPKVRAVRLWHAVGYIPGLFEIQEGKLDVHDRRGEVNRRALTHEYCSKEHQS
jgi:hypothetical protein